MLFSHKKRIQRDRDAGLVFHWRGGVGENNGGLLMAIVCTLGLFGFAFWAVEYASRDATVDTVQTAEFMLIDDMTPEMALWSDQSSPFPPRWDPADDRSHDLRVSEGVHAVLASLALPEIKWHRMPEVSRPVTSPPLLEPGRLVLGPLPSDSLESLTPAQVELSPTMAASGDLKKRLPVKAVPFLKAIAAESYGQRMSFLVALDASGKVVQCAPADWVEGELAKDLENWVRTQQYLPANEPIQMGEIKVRVGKVKP